MKKTEIVVCSIRQHATHIPTLGTRYRRTFSFKPCLIYLREIGRCLLCPRLHRTSR